MTRVVCGLFMIWAVMTASPASGAGGESGHGPALAGLSDVTVYFDVNVGNAGLLSKRIGLIERTLDDLHQSNIEVAAVVGFRSQASRFVTGGNDYVLDEELAAKEEIQEGVRTLASRGVRLEQCSIAARQQGVDRADILAEIEVVPNGYVSMVGYQAQGYAIIPMD